MKPLQIVLAIDLSIAALISVFFGLVLQYAYVIPLFLVIVGVINLALAGIFFFGGENRMGAAFIAGALLLLAGGSGYYGYMMVFDPEGLEMMRHVKAG